MDSELKKNGKKDTDGVYAEHLAGVNETRGVLATEDIFNDRGLLLIKKGNPLTPKVVQSIIEFKLFKPLEHSIAIGHELRGDDLLKQFTKILEDDPILRSIHERYKLESSITYHCKFYEEFPLLIQKITVMAERMPETFSRTLYSVWFGLLIAKEMHLAANDTAMVFLAALSHDIGMLHIDPAVLNKKGELSSGEWRQIQGHVAIGRKILMSIQEVPGPVCIAVVEHHERCDGTGYPLGKVESELSLVGQIVALTDSIIAIYFNNLKPKARGWRELIPILQMNNHAFMYRNYEVLITILRRSELPSSEIVSKDDMPRFFQELVSKNRLLKSCFDQVCPAVKQLGFTHNDRKLHAIQNVFFQIFTAVHNSGIFEDYFIAWLQHVNDFKLVTSYREMEDVFLMQEELAHHLKRLSRMSQAYQLEKPVSNKHIEQVVDACVFFLLF